jgi:putative ABC transport system permease protein
LSLAFSTLIYEWRRYLGAVIALAVAGLLVLAMTGLFMGLSKSFTSTVDRSPAQIMVLPPKAENLFGNNTQPRHIIPEIYEHSDVLEVKPLNMNFGGWSNFPKDNQPAKNEGVQIMIVDPEVGSVTLPSDFKDQVLEALREPFAVVVDRSNLVKLGVQLGDKAKINGRTVWVRATTEGYPSLFNSVVFMSHQTAKLLALVDDGPRVGPLVVRIKASANAAHVAAELTLLGKGQFKAWSREDLSDTSQRAMLKDGGIAVMLGFAVVVGIFIGIVITWQTLQSAILANIREFASLRALGISMGSLRLIILELSIWVGLAGLVLTGALTGVVWILAKTFGVPMDFPLFVDLPVAGALLLIAVLSGVFSLGVLKKSEPADLLR